MSGWWVNRVHLDSANTFAFRDADLDVTSITPGGAPWVSHDIVFLTVLRAVSYSSNCVVKCSSASCSIQDSALVMMEHCLVGVNWNWDWSFLDRCLKLSSGIGWHAVIGLNVHFSLGAVILAGACTSVAGGILVIRLKLLLVALEILESCRLVSSVTTMRLRYAWDQLLFG